MDLSLYTESSEREGSCSLQDKKIPSSLKGILRLRIFLPLLVGTRALPSGGRYDGIFQRLNREGPWNSWILIPPCPPTLSQGTCHPPCVDFRKLVTFLQLRSWAKNIVFYTQARKLSPENLQAAYLFLRRGFRWNSHQPGFANTSKTGARERKIKTIHAFWTF